MSPEEITIIGINFENKGDYEKTIVDLFMLYIYMYMLCVPDDNKQ